MTHPLKYHLLRNLYMRSAWEAKKHRRDSENAIEFAEWTFLITANAKHAREAWHHKLGFDIDPDRTRLNALVNSLRGPIHPGGHAR